MVKDDKDVIAEFNEYVNMTASELEKWLESEESGEAGWRKDGGDGKSVGQDSGEKIIEILKANPKKDPEKYTEDQIQHMRKVAAYCKRHLAQEAGSLEEKDPEEAKKTKSYISLKNWGHDPLKAHKSSSKNGNKSGSKDKDGQAEGDGQEENGDDEEEENEEEAEKDEKKAGDKRKKSGQQNGANKKRETRQGASSNKNGDVEDDQDDDDADDDGDNGEQEEEDGGDDSGGKKPSKNGPKKGETVSWNWGSGNPEGKVLDVKEDE